MALRAVAFEQGVDDRATGRQEPRPDGIDGDAGPPRRRPVSRREDRLDRGDPLAGQDPVGDRLGKHLDQVRGGAADGDDLGRRRVRGAAERRRRRRRASPRPRSGVGGSCVANRSVRRADPSWRPAARAGATASTMQNSELPPPTSTTSVSWVTGMPSVTPMIVRYASSSCDRTWSGAPAASAASRTMRAASAARRIGSVPRNVTSAAPSARARSRRSGRACVGQVRPRGRRPRKPRSTTAEPSPRNADSSTNGSRWWPRRAATRRWTEFEPRSTDAPTTRPADEAGWAVAEWSVTLRTGWCRGRSRCLRLRRTWSKWFAVSWPWNRPGWPRSSAVDRLAAGLRVVLAAAPAWRRRGLGAGRGLRRLPVSRSRPPWSTWPLCRRPSSPRRPLALPRPAWRRPVSRQRSWIAWLASRPWPAWSSISRLSCAWQPASAWSSQRLQACSPQRRPAAGVAAAGFAAADFAAAVRLAAGLRLDFAAAAGLRVAARAAGLAPPPRSSFAAVVRRRAGLRVAAGFGSPPACSG